MDVVENEKCSGCKRFEPLSAFASEMRQTPYKTCETCREAMKNRQERNRLEMNDKFFRNMQSIRLASLVRNLGPEKEDHPEVVEKALEIARARNKISAYAEVVKERIGEARWLECQGFARDNRLEINHLPRNGVRFSDAFKAFYQAVKDGEPYEEILVDLLHADRIDPCSKKEHAKLTKEERQENANYYYATWYEQYGRWRAEFKVNGENKHVGYYCTRQQALDAARAARASFISTGHYENPPRRKQNALVVVEGPEGSEDWRVYKGKELISKFATEQEARADLERRYIRRYFN